MDREQGAQHWEGMVTLTRDAFQYPPIVNFIYSSSHGCTFRRSQISCSAVGILHRAITFIVLSHRQVVLLLSAGQSIEFG